VSRRYDTLGSHKLLALASPLKQPLPGDVAAKLEEIMRRADEKLG